MAWTKSFHNNGTGSGGKLEVGNMLEPMGQGSGLEPKEICMLMSVMDHRFPVGQTCTIAKRLACRHKQHAFKQESLHSNQVGVVVFTWRNALLT